MNKNKFIKLSSLIFLFSLFLFSCKEESYSLGELTKPSNLVINTAIAGQTTANPNGDGSGVVNITAYADNALTYKIGYQEVANINANPTFESMTLFSGGAKVNKKFNTLGDIAYRITVIAYGKGGTSTVSTKDITVKSTYNVDPVIVTNLTNNSSKTWKVDQSVAGHFGVGPWDPTSATPAWWSAGVNEKANCCNCFYTARFTFKEVATNTYSIQVSTPDGAFTKTGSLAGIPGIPSSGSEGCYAYGGGSGAFTFIESTSGVVPTAQNPSTKASILLASNTTFIGYGALQKEYEIMVINANYLYLRVRGTETGNAWYLKLIPA